MVHRFLPIELIYLVSQRPRRSFQLTPYLICSCLPVSVLDHYRGHTMPNSSTDPTPSSELSTLELLMQQARTKLQRPTTSTLNRQRRDDDSAELDRRLDRCIRRTEKMLIEARAFLNDPARAPRLLTSPIEVAEKRKSAGLLLSEHTAHATQVSSDRAYGRAMALLEMQQARRTHLPASPPGDRS